MANVSKLRRLTARMATRALGWATTAYTGRSVYLALDGDSWADTNPDLRGQQRFSAYIKMRRRVPPITSYYRLMAGIASKAKFVTAEPEDMDAVNEVMGSMTGAAFANVQASMMESTTHGFALNEVVLGRTAGNGRWGVRTINRIPQNTIERTIKDNIGRVDSFVQFMPVSVVIPRAKCLYTKFGNGDFGDGVFADVAELALKYMNHQDRVQQSLDANHRNIPDVKMPLEAYNDADNRFSQGARQLLENKDQVSHPRFEEPSDLQFGEDVTGGARLIGHPMYEFRRVPPIPMKDNDRLWDMAKEIAHMLNAEALTLGSDGAGSLALSRTQLSTLMQMADSNLQLAAEEYQRLISEIWALNGMTGRVPEIIVDRSGWLDQREAAEIVAMMKGVPIEVYGQAINEVLEQAGLKPIDVMEQARENGMLSGGNNRDLDGGNDA